jgi:hypothetical protein
MNTTTDPHLIGTSASSAAADRLCPGRYLASRGLPDTHTEIAASGSRIHAALAENAREGINSGTLLSLTPEEREMFDSCREIERKLIAQIWNGESDPTNRVWKEQRYWCKVESGPRHTDQHKDQPVLYLHSGQADFVNRRKNIALILDYKTGSGDVPESPKNEQLRDLAVMVWRTLIGVDEVIVAIVQPLATYSPELCRYTRPELEQAEEEMWERVRKSNDPKSPRVAGDVQCKFCKAKGVCKEYAQWAASLLPEKPTPLAIAMSEWSLEQRSAVAEHLPRLRKLLDDAEGFLKAALTADPEGVPGFFLKPGITRETINDPQELFNRFVQSGGTLEQFMASVGITKKKLEEQVRVVTNTKGKALKSKLEEMLQGIVDAKQNAPSLARKEDT